MKRLEIRVDEDQGYCIFTDLSHEESISFMLNTFNLLYHEYMNVYMKDSSENTGLTPEIFVKGLANIFVAGIREVEQDDKILDFKEWRIRHGH